MNLEEPLPSDCCGSGCSPCVFDIYRQRLQDSLVTSQQPVNNCVRTDLLSETRFKPFRLLKKCQIAENVFEFRFQPAENISEICYEEVEVNGILPYGVGQHLFLKCRLSGEPFETGIGSTIEDASNLLNNESCSNSSDKKIVIRAYTPITIASEEKNCCFNIFVKLYDRGIASEHFNKSSVGAIFYWRGPYGSFRYNSNSVSHILMLCVGTGLAPMISVVNTIINNELDETIVHLKCGFKNMNQVIQRNELKKMAHFWNCTIEYYFSHSSTVKNNIQFGEQINMKKLDKSSIEDYIANITFKELLVLICGTECFTAEMKNIVTDLNVNNTNIYVF